MRNHVTVSVGINMDVTESTANGCLKIVEMFLNQNNDKMIVEGRYSDGNIRLKLKNKSCEEDHEPDEYDDYDEDEDYDDADYEDNYAEDVDNYAEDVDDYAEDVDDYAEDVDDYAEDVEEVPDDEEREEREKRSDNHINEYYYLTKQRVYKHINKR